MRHKTASKGKRNFPDPSVIFGKTEIRERPKVTTDLYAQQRQASAILRAKENGYFLNLTKAFIEKNIAPEVVVDDNGNNDELSIPDSKDCPDIIQYLRKNVRRHDISRVYLVHLPRMHLRSLGDISACRNLSICILCNNFINRFDALKSCPLLTKLDLHGNQIVIIPDYKFWKSMEFLRILNLHDNPIGSLSNLHNLASSPSLVAMTIFDTPFSLRRNYRHHLVNGIWTLKALDNHVISDEELIEDAHFRGRYKALTPPFAINLCTNLKEETTFEEESEWVKMTLRRIEEILTHNSPVLILQRFIRGYLVRRQMQHCLWKMRSVPSPMDLKESLDSSPQKGEGCYIIGNEDENVAELRRAMGQLSFQQSHGPQSVTIDMSRLQETVNILENETTTEETYSLLSKCKAHRQTHVKSDEKSEKTAVKEKWKKKEQGSTVGDGLQVDLDKSEDPELDLYIQGTQKDPIYCDPGTYVMMERKEIGSEVRLAVANYHRRSRLRRATSAKGIKKNRCNEERFFQRTQATMGFGCIRAVQQAYKQRDQEEERVAKSELVSARRQCREDGQFRVKLHRQEQRSCVMKSRMLDKYDILNILRNQDLWREKEAEKARQRNLLWGEILKNKKEEQTYVKDLTGSLMSLAKSQFSAKSSIDKSSNKSIDKSNERSSKSEKSRRMKRPIKKQTEMVSKEKESTENETTTDSEK